MILDNQTVLITGGTGTFGKAFTKYLLDNSKIKKVIIYSRDEFKQYHFKKELQTNHQASLDKVRFFIGDIRDLNRLELALKDVDYVVHAAAMKHVSACEYNPFEAIKTNILGAQNLVRATLSNHVKKVVALSTDKAVNPVNLYGGTKLVSDKLFISANAYSGEDGTRFSVVRYGNVAGSRGSVIPFFMDLIKNGATKLPITDFQMTRFWITIDQGIDLVIKALTESIGGETYISKIPSFKVTDLAKAIAPHAELEEIGIREGEKLHELMINKDDSRYTYEWDDHFIIFPNLEWWNSSKNNTNDGKKVKDGFKYSSDNNAHFLSIEDIKEKLVT